MFKPLLIIVAGLAAASASRAGEDWVALRLPPSHPQGSWEGGLQWSYGRRQAWALGVGSVRMLDSDGRIKELRAMDLLASLRWGVAEGQSLAAKFPYVFRELSPSTSGTNATFALNDPSLRRGDGTGDLALEWRSRLGANAGAGLELTLPLGLGPMESQHPLVATGGGRWALAPWLTAGGARGPLQAWVQAGGVWMAGQGADISQEAVVGYSSTGAQKLPPGRAYLGPRWGLELGAGMGLDWHREAKAHHSVAVELRHNSLSEWVLDGQSVAGSDTHLLECIPQLQARFERFSAVAGWALPLSARNVPLALGGEWRLRLELAL